MACSSGLAPRRAPRAAAGRAARGRRARARRPRALAQPLRGRAARRPRGSPRRSSAAAPATRHGPSHVSQSCMCSSMTYSASSSSTRTLLASRKRTMVAVAASSVALARAFESVQSRFSRGGTCGTSSPCSDDGLRMSPLRARALGGDARRAARAVRARERADAGRRRDHRALVVRDARSRARAVAARGLTWPCSAATVGSAAASAPSSRRVAPDEAQRAVGSAQRRRETVHVLRAVERLPREALAQRCGSMLPFRTTSPFCAARCGRARVRRRATAHTEPFARSSRAAHRPLPPRARSRARARSRTFV